MATIMKYDDNNNNNSEQKTDKQQWNLIWIQSQKCTTDIVNHWLSTHKIEVGIWKQKPKKKAKNKNCEKPLWITHEIKISK